jgi:acetyl esterase/lipase
MLPGEHLLMGVRILIFLFVIEGVLWVTCLMAGSRQDQIRSVVRISLFALFLILVWTSVIEWGFRWYGLGMLLFIQAGRGVWTLSHPPEPLPGKTRQGRLVFRSLAAVLLTFAALLPVLVFPPSQPLMPTGSYSVSSVRYTFLDEDRAELYSTTAENRQVNLDIWYPENAGSQETFPLVVFSHGGLGTENSNESLYLELASHGYVVCSIVHPYHAFWTKAENGRVTFLSRTYFGELQREDAQTNKQQSFEYYQSWMKTRTADINLVLDTLLIGVENGADGVVYRLINPERIGVMGHSLGGSAALGIPRQRSDIDVVIALESPYLSDITGVDKGDFTFTGQDYPVPVLNIYSDSAWEHLAEWPQYARNYEYLSSSRETIHSLYLAGAGHFSLTDLGLASPFLVGMLEGGKPDVAYPIYLERVNQACLEFLDRTLKNP